MGSTAFVGAASVSASAFVARRSTTSDRASVARVPVARRPALRMAADDEEKVRFVSSRVGAQSGLKKFRGAAWGCRRTGRVLLDCSTGVCRWHDWW